MKSTKEQIVAIAFLTFVILLEFGSFFYFKKFSLFYEPPALDEVNHQLFSTLDPLLGYAHSARFEPTELDLKLGLKKFTTEINLKNGFVEYENKIDANPLKIAILGDSISDPHMFNGNWPFRLHQLLKEKKISHVIYNGAVSGYTSYQQLIKLIRDVYSLDKIDIVIAYTGAAEIPEAGDSVLNYPAIHTYQKFIFDKMAQNFTTEKKPVILPNMQYILYHLYRVIINPEENFIQFGVKNTALLQSYINNLRYMNAVAEINHSIFYHFLEPIRLNDNQIDTAGFVDKNAVASKEVEQKLQQFFSQADVLLKNEKFSHSLYKFFPEDKKMFLDLFHLNKTGNKLVAEMVFKTITPSLK